MKITIEFDKNSESWDQFDEQRLNATVNADKLATVVVLMLEKIRSLNEIDELSDRNCEELFEIVEEWIGSIDNYTC